MEQAIIRTRDRGVKFRHEHQMGSAKCRTSARVPWIRQEDAWLSNESKEIPFSVVSCPYCNCASLLIGTTYLSHQSGASLQEDTLCPRPSESLTLFRQGLWAQAMCPMVFSDPNNKTRSESIL